MAALSSSAYHRRVMACLHEAIVAATVVAVVAATIASCIHYIKVVGMFCSVRFMRSSI